ncbi:hypothetical protein BDV33DRAFT_210825 [Aspergillus novoparasiticus]|uniref:Uncharacterized protein n=1 Tax=Aspergillus novoparasiticus TaxID=986946 RepID=A0A5N6E5G8_9EURO|nr:hypothetical protein BDV33DRAFT_210825 [Aspergillus novoparasiticus]
MASVSLPLAATVVVVPPAHQDGLLARMASVSLPLVVTAAAQPAHRDGLLEQTESVNPPRAAAVVVVPPAHRDGLLAPMASVNPPRAEAAAALPAHRAGLVDLMANASLLVHSVPQALYLSRPGPVCLRLFPSSEILGA